MSELDDSFAKLLGRQATDAEKQALYRVRDALGLKNNDALWLVLMALQDYERRYAAFPKRIEDAAGQVLAKVKTASDAAVKASVEASKADLARAIAQTAQQVARDTSRKQMFQWAAGCVAVVAVALVGTSSVAFRHGQAAGYARGYEETRDEKAAAAWSATPEGKLAFRLAQTVSIKDIASCSRPGWVVDKGNCFPKQAPDGRLHGWKLP